MPGEEIKLLEQIARSLERLEATSSQGAGIGAGGKGAAAAGARSSGKGEETSILVRGQQRLTEVATGRAFGGGVPGMLASGALGAAAGAAGLIGAGAINASRGGTFGAGVSRGILGAVAAIPIAGELTGAAPAERIASGTEGELNALTNQVARFAGPGAVTPKIRSFLTETIGQQQKNIEADRQANTASVNSQLGKLAAGQGSIPELVVKLGQLVDVIGRLVATSGGASQRT